MNWKLIFTLSLAGVVVALATTFGVVHSSQEWLVWLVIFILYAYIIARRTSSRRFVHGFMVSLFNGIWMGSIHSLLFSQYIANNPQMVEQSKSLPELLPMQTMMLIMGPIIGAVTGLVCGLFAWVAGRIIDKPTT